MSLSKKSDVKNHLSTGRHKTLLSLRPTTQPDIVGNSGNQLRYEDHDTPASLQESGLRFYAVVPVTTIHALISSGNSTDEPIVNMPQA